MQANRRIDVEMTSAKRSWVRDMRCRTAHDGSRPCWRLLIGMSNLLEERVMKTPNRISVVLAAAALAAMIGCASTSTQESTGQYVDDTVITTKVKTAILNDPALKSSEINVETYKGVVQLSGFVSSQTMVEKAVAHARGVGGVVSVKNDMHLK